MTNHHTFLAGPTFQCNWTSHRRPPVFRDHTFTPNEVVFQDRFYCILLHVVVCNPNSPILYTGTSTYTQFSYWYCYHTTSAQSVSIWRSSSSWLAAVFSVASPHWVRVKVMSRSGGEIWSFFPPPNNKLHAIST